ncbi:MAG: YcgN family cysteine cluster protein [Gammaproteobacteria bacterium]|nr:YcgN family cysteine cluster protein [Gammaproteobacteria bacterium]
MERNFWQHKTLAELNQEEWESLCDGCGRCCMIKIEDADSGEVHYTSLTCRLLDLDTCRCTRYPERHKLVADCVELTPFTAARFDWLPVTCAYRRLARGQQLLWWHPLVSGDPRTVHEAGVSVLGKTLPVDSVHADEHEQHIIRWIETSPNEEL